MRNPCGDETIRTDKDRDGPDPLFGRCGDDRVRVRRLGAHRRHQDVGRHEVVVRHLRQPWAGDANGRERRREHGDQDGHDRLHAAGGRAQGRRQWRGGDRIPERVHDHHDDRPPGARHQLHGRVVGHRHDADVREPHRARAEGNDHARRRCRLRHGKHVRPRRQGQDRGHRRAAAGVGHLRRGAAPRFRRIPRRFGPELSEPRCRRTGDPQRLVRRGRERERPGRAGRSRVGSCRTPRPEEV